VITRNITDLIDPGRRYTISRADRHGIRVERRYDTDPADLWDACTDPSRLSRWLGVLRSVPTEGDTAELVLGPAPDAGTEDRQPVTVTVHRCDPPRRLVATWRYPGEQATLVELRLEPDGEGTALTFEHLAMPVAAVGAYGPGWEALLARLAAWLHGGDPVPAVAEIEPLTGPLWAAADRLPDRWPQVDRERGLIEARREVAADPARVWAAITGPDRLGAWFGALEGGPEGWTIAFTDGTARGVVRDCSPPRRLVTTWRWDFQPAEVADSVLTVDLAAAGAGTTVRLRHEHVAQGVVGYGAGWFAHLEALAGALSGRGQTEADWQTDWTVAMTMMG
jgi:uncharacterized protein YndB with AHSA1/START domain